jgi:hypothetical protein
VGYIDEDVQIHEGVGGDVLPEDPAFRIEEKGAVEGFFLDITVGTVGSERAFPGVVDTLGAPEMSNRRACACGRLT